MSGATNLWPREISNLRLQIHKSVCTLNEGFWLISLSLSKAKNFIMFKCLLNLSILMCKCKGKTLRSRKTQSLLQQINRTVPISLNPLHSQFCRFSGRGRTVWELVPRRQHGRWQNFSLDAAWMRWIVRSSLLCVILSMVFWRWEEVGRPTKPNSSERTHKFTDLCGQDAWHEFVTGQRLENVLTNSQIYKPKFECVDSLMEIENELTPILA
jgi:hypothetical protein